MINWFSFFFNCYGRILPTIATVALYTSLVSFAVILITVPAKAPTHQDAQFVFTTFINNTGWKSSGIAFIVGLINPNWGFSCLDTVVCTIDILIHSPLLIRSGAYCRGVPSTRKAHPNRHHWNRRYWIRYVVHLLYFDDV